MQEILAYNKMYGWRTSENGSLFFLHEQWLSMTSLILKKTANKRCYVSKYPQDSSDLNRLVSHAHNCFATIPQEKDEFMDAKTYFDTVCPRSTSSCLGFLTWSGSTICWEGKKDTEPPPRRIIDLVKQQHAHLPLNPHLLLEPNNSPSCGLDSRRISWSKYSTRLVRRR